MQRTAIYMRVSTAVQAEQGDSIPAQRDALRKYIDSKPDLVFVGEYLDDGISGTKDDRDELIRMLDDVKEGKIDLILVTKLDRLYRNLRHYLNLQDTLDKHGVNWIAIWETMYDTTTPQGRLIISQMMSIAQFEAENTGSRIRQVQAYKVSQGEVISGTAPAGYKIENKHLVPDENAPVIREVFETFARTGMLYETSRKYSEYPFIPNSGYGFKQLLKNRKYIGEFRGNKNYCEPIVDRDLFDRVQLELSRNIKKSQKRVYIFSGLLKCAECGKVMVGNYFNRKHRGRTEKVKRYRCAYCWCKPVRMCDNKKNISELSLEKYLLANIRPLITELIYTVEEQPVKDNKSKIASIQRKIDRLKELYINELISLDEYKRDKEQFQKDIQALYSPRAQSNHADLKKLLATDFETLYASFTEQEKRFFWRSIIRDITFGKNRDIEVIFL